MALENDRGFEAALADCCARVQQGEALETCLGGYPAAYQEELRRLVPLAGGAARLGSDPSPLFRAQLEQRLIGAMEARRVSRSSGWRGWLAPAPAFRLAGVALMLLVVLGGGGAGATYAAEHSLPDSPLYEVKRTRERVQLALARDDQAVELAASQTEKREQEIDAAVQSGKREAVVDQLGREVRATVQNWVKRALAAAAEGKYQPARRALEGIRGFQTRLATNLQTAGPAVRPTLLQLQRYLEEQERLLTSVLPAQVEPPRNQPVRPEPVRPGPVLTPAARPVLSPRPADAPVRIPPTATPPTRVQPAASVVPAAPAATEPAPTATAPTRLEPTLTAVVPARTEPTPTAVVPTRTPATPTATARTEPTPTPTAPVRTQSTATPARTAP